MACEKHKLVIGDSVETDFGRRFICKQCGLCVLAKACPIVGLEQKQAVTERVVKDTYTYVELTSTELAQRIVKNVTYYEKL